MTRVGIVGHAADKFTVPAMREARDVIRQLLTPGDAVLVSGGCHLGGIDIWAEEIADVLGREKVIHLPADHSWSKGYKPRNLLIAADADELHCIVVDAYPPGYRGMRFKACYHCNGATTHVKSGGCWTMNQAAVAGKKARLWIVEN